MEFMLLFLDREGVPHDPAAMAEMGAFARELATRGKLRRGAPLTDESTVVRVRGGTVLVTEGPFAESKELVAGFWIVDVVDRDEAIDVARRCPHARRGGAVEVHRVRWRDTVPDPGRGAAFLLAFRVEPGLADPDGAKLREMIAFGDALKREGIFVETAPLVYDEPAARVETRAGRTMVTDGPFAEAKEMVGGYGVVRVADRSQAVEVARRYPHARWGPVEVREIMFFDRV